MNHFNQSVTEGFSDEILEKMNIDFEEAVKNLEENDDSYLDEMKYISDKIFNKYC